MGQYINFDASQVLIVGGRPHSVQVLRQALSLAGVKNARFVEEPQPAVDLLRTESFLAVLCEPCEFDAKAFILAARRTEGIRQPMIPIFLVCLRPRQQDVEAARDLGFTNVIARPLSAGTLRRKLRSALGQPRTFIATSNFFGPDRRTRAGHWNGQERRERLPRKVKVAASQEAE